MGSFRDVYQNNYLLCSQSVLSFSPDKPTNCFSSIKPYQGRARQVWISPESTAIYLIPQNMFDDAFSLEDLCSRWGISRDMHRISFHRIDEWLGVIVIDNEEWARLLQLACKLVPYLGCSKLFFLDVWMMQQALLNRENVAVLHLPGVKYSYHFKEAIPTRLVEKSTSEMIGIHDPSAMSPILSTCYAVDLRRFGSISEYICGSWGGHRYAQYALIMLLTITFGLAALTVSTHWRLISFKAPYRLQLQSYAKKNEGIIGHLNAGNRRVLSTYFDRVIDPLGEIIHTKSFLNQMIFNPITNSMLLIGSISDGSEVTQWMALRKYDVYKNLQVSMLSMPDNHALNKLDGIFLNSTDAFYDASILVLQQPYLLPNFYTKTISKALFFLSQDREDI